MADQTPPIPPRPPATARLLQRAGVPPGALPRYAQHAAIGGLALLMIAVMVLTGRPPVIGDDVGAMLQAVRRAEFATPRAVVRRAGPPPHDRPIREQHARR